MSSQSTNSNYFSISTSNNKVIDEIIVYYLLGQDVLYKKEMTAKIDISRLKKGIYMLELLSDKLRIQKKLIIK